MRLLLINPNMTESMTRSMTDVARVTAGPAAEIVPLTATTGFPYISSRAEAQIAGAGVLETIASHRHDVDAVIIAAFGDPGLVAARELFDLPIVGMAEAAVMSAAMLGERFSVVTFSPHMARWYDACVRQTGLGGRFTGVRCPADPPAQLGDVQTALRPELIALAHDGTRSDGADVVILGGAPLAGLAPQIAHETPGILVDPIAAATAQAMALARLSPSYRNRTARPAAKTSTGLGQALSTVIAGETT
ncbi:Hydantoin racemase [Candidatus Rhodobacter oscarellae]|uniref:Hydantoin racemase n=1 Tax=Candidatus Rhodobacter oscarellae TaxID=1675527 RepID=A0A0J9E4L5_9RHOB|nr:aspartate/glutamate racemase family protein [Candidatus Rhodobacter lobularis]KMW57672.1 Hydantoin racemase [Candidatus Rhodobacter lobularis]